MCRGTRVVAIVAAGGLGSWFVQNAYSGGPPDLVIAGLTVIDPIVGIAIGIAILGELRPDVHAVTAIAMGAAAFACYRGSDRPLQAPPRSHQAQEGRAEGRGRVS